MKEKRNEEEDTCGSISKYTYTCYAIRKFILYLYRDRIYEVLYVILYLYGLLHTVSNLPFLRATPNERDGYADEAQASVKETKKKKNGESERKKVAKFKWNSKDRKETDHEISLLDTQARYHY